MQSTVVDLSVSGWLHVPVRTQASRSNKDGAPPAQEEAAPPEVGKSFVDEGGHGALFTAAS